MQCAQPKTAKSVAAILEKELEPMISEWKRQAIHKLELFHGRDSAVPLRFLSNTGITRHINSLGGT
jgi:hypothetical protein